MFICKSNTLESILTIVKSGLSQRGVETLIIVLLKKKTRTIIEHDYLLKRSKQEACYKKKM